MKVEGIGWPTQVPQDRKGLHSDYMELVELIIIFLGGVPADGFRFGAP